MNKTERLVAISLEKGSFLTKRVRMELDQHSVLGSNTYLMLYEAFCCCFGVESHAGYLAPC